MARNRKFTNAKYVSDLMRSLPKRAYRRRALYNPDGRRCEYWVFEKRAGLHNLGDVTMVSTDAQTNLYLSHGRLSIDAECIGLGARTYKNHCASVLISPQNDERPSG